MTVNRKFDKMAAFSFVKIGKIGSVITFFYLMFLNFYNNKWDLVDSTWFWNWQADSENLVTKTILNTKRNGLFSNYGLLDGYLEQIGLQGFFFSFINLIVPGGGIHYELLSVINVILFTLIIFLLLFWIYKEFGFSAVLFSYLSIMFSNWIIVSARNLYWVPFTFFLPFVCILICLYYEEKHGKNTEKWMYLTAFITIFIRSACGYEFISTIMICMELPFIYYGIKNRWFIKKYVKRSFIAGLCAISGFILAISINLVQGSLYLKSFKDALSFLKYTVSKRTGFFNIRMSGELRESLFISTGSVLKTYLHDGIAIISNFRMELLILFFLIFMSLTFVSEKFAPNIQRKRKKLIALCIMNIVACIGTLSWFVLAKGHSYIHTHINYILWSVPFTITSFALVGSVFYILCNDIWCRIKKKYRYTVVIAMSVMAFLCYWDSFSYGNKVLDDVLKHGKVLFQSEHGFDMYYIENNFYYVADKKIDTEDYFFLHLYSDNSKDISAEIADVGFINNDFVFKENQLKLPIWKNKKIAEVKIRMPHPISKINTGQVINEKRSWEIELPNEKIFNNIQYIVPAALSDENWDYGISKDRTILLLSPMSYEYSQLVGKYLVQDHNKKMLITDVKFIDQYVYIILSEPITLDINTVISFEILE